MMPPAIILCGGRATRLASLHGDRPKALVPVAGRPFLEWQLAWLARGGVRHVHLAAGHMADQLAAWAGGTGDAGRNGIPGMKLTLSTEPRPLGTGGGLRYAADVVEGDALLVVNGDTLLPGLEFQGLEAAAGRASKGWTSIAVTRVDDAARFGTVTVEDGRVVEFLEKGRAAAGWINGGVYRLSREAVESIPRDTAVSVETDLFPGWARDGRVAAAAADPPLLDMGTPDGLAEMTRWLETEPRRRP